VTTDSPAVGQFVLLADESAHWKIAGLTQLERILLGLNEFAASDSSFAQLSVVLFWRPDLPPNLRCSTGNRRLSRISCTESLEAARPGATVLSTRYFIGRGAVGEMLASAQHKVERPVTGSLESWSELFQKLEHNPGDIFSYLAGVGDLPECERQFLRGAGKSQDGLVSRFLNRPISRVVTRFLLRYPITPTGWTIAIFVLPLAAFLFLLRGDYAGILAGAFIFQAYSILDGCDGEIARAKYLESARGGRIDDFLDLIGSVLFVTGLGAGLSRFFGSLPYLEGVACAAVIILKETILRLSRTPSSPLPRASGLSAERAAPRRGGAPTQSGSLNPALYPRHREMIQNSGLLALGEKKAWWIVQCTKRDVAMFVFLLLALANRGRWILHLWITVSTAVLALTIRARLHRGRS
jgi:hypothetical protein